MQHGTGRELVSDALENVLAVLSYERDANGRPLGDVIKATRQALNVLDTAEDLDKRGEYGPDYGPGMRRPRVSPTRQQGLTSGPFQGSNPRGRTA